MKKFTLLVVFTFFISFLAAAQFTSITSLNPSPVDVGAGTQDKSQSKSFFHDGKHWAVFANSTGTHLWRLDGKSWTHVLMLATRRGRADCKVVGNVLHVLIFQNKTSHLVSLEYVAASATFKIWPQRTSTVNFLFDGEVQTATIDMDGTGRMWMAYVRGTSVLAQWSDSPYASWSSPVILATGVRTDDAAAVIALPGKIGVLWSNQVTKRWGFKTHTDGASPSSWSDDEVPASQSALSIGAGMADDHMNMKVASDGTLYCATKTGYNDSGYPLITLLVRRPSGSWDDVYNVSNTGTTPIVTLNEQAGKLRVIYASKTYGGDILYNESPMSQISFGPKLTLMPGNAYRDPVSSKQNFRPDGVVLFTDATAGIVAGVIASDNTTTPQPTVPAAPILASPANAATGIALNPTLSWNSSSGAETYQVQVATSSGFASTVYDKSGIANTSVQVSGLTNNTVYYWRARATNGAGSSNWSTTWSFTTVEATAVQYTLAVTTVGSGTVAKSPNQSTYAAGSTVTLTASPAAGYEFAGWSGAVSGTANSTTVTMDGNKAVTATFTAVTTPPAQYTLAVSTVGSGTVAKSPNQSTYSAGSTVTLTASPAAGYQFAGWSGAASGTANPTTVAMDGNKAVTATFTAVSTGGAQVTGFVLVSATTEQDLQPLADGATINLSALGSPKLNIRATTSPATVGSVKFELSGAMSKTYSDNAPPYALHGDNGSGNYYFGNWSPPATGTYTLKATPYSLAKGRGTAGTPMTISFTITSNSLSRSNGNTLHKSSPGMPQADLRVYPNPFSDRANLSFSLPEAGGYSVSLYDARGFVVRNLAQGNATTGENISLDVDGANLPKGIYLVRLQTATATQTVKLILNR